jgi:hypothetical protein
MRIGVFTLVLLQLSLEDVLNKLGYHGNPLNPDPARAEHENEKSLKTIELARKKYRTGRVAFSIRW